MAESSKNTPILLLLIAVLIGYAGWSGAGLELMGVDGVQVRREKVTAMRDTLETLRTQIDAAKASLARESVEDVRARVEAYRASLGILRTLVPEQREVANLIDDINVRAKIRGLQVTNFVPATPIVGPEPFDTHVYQFAVTGRYNQIGQFLADVASLKRIIVTGDLAMARANAATSRALGDTLATLETKFSVRTYVKASAQEEQTNAQ